MNRYLLLLLASLTLLLTACQKDEENITINDQPTISTLEGEYPGVVNELWPYFQRFEEAAAARGISISLAAAGITGVIEEIDEENVAGTCRFNSHMPNHVTIDKSFWDIASDRFREFIIFHELGHCSLLRDHREDAYSSGACISIMRSGLGDCRDNYTPRNRAIYLDELFFPAEF
ncbi:MAG: hypothetical protein AAGG75_18020 [Bacteroidota bacterium]